MLLLRIIQAVFLITFQEMFRLITSINKDIVLNDNQDIGITADTTKNVFVNNGSSLKGYDGETAHNNGITVADGYTLNLTGSENASMDIGSYPLDCDKYNIIFSDRDYQGLFPDDSESKKLIEIFETLIGNF